MAISRAEKTFGKAFQLSTTEGVDIIDLSGWGNVSLKGPFLNGDLEPLTDTQQMKAVSNVAKHIQQNTAVDTHIIDTTGMSTAAEETLRQAVRNANQRIIFMRGD
ncbi:hypothetical protein [Rhizobacter sp. Root1221]|uniref:hypothetical protein n=1 Tax=Rhizobacter sp. Root1221 TaxID=1736433 RepID=UPI0006F3FEDD|nr:hypothetical protein [Rhizobacter sp. Root1221]KQW01222.1 hypothetical protein ASC87_15130 [Rhizobacter sp. Root1221]